MLVVCRSVVSGAYVPYAQQSVAKGTLYDIAMLRDAEQPCVVTVGQDRQLRTWDLATGRFLRSCAIPGGADAVKVCALRRALVVCSHQDGAVRCAVRNSASFSAEISVRSPRKLFIFTI